MSTTFPNIETEKFWCKVEALNVYAIVSAPTALTAAVKLVSDQPETFGEYLHEDIVVEVRQGQYHGPAIAKIRVWLHPSQNATGLLSAVPLSDETPSVAEKSA